MSLPDDSLVLVGGRWKWEGRTVAVLAVAADYAMVQFRDEEPFLIPIEELRYEGKHVSG